MCNTDAKNRTKTWKMLCVCFYFTNEMNKLVNEMQTKNGHQNEMAFITYKANLY